MAEVSIESVKDFWENNPLFTGESQHKPGTLAFFEDHYRIYIEDVFAGKFDLESFIGNLNNQKVLDLGAGVGFWSTEICKSFANVQLTYADLTSNAIDITGKRLTCYGLEGHGQIENAESMTFSDSIFDHVNCQGVIHHTPDTQMAIREIARVLKPNGTASISVYYKNWFLRNWKIFSRLGKLLTSFGAGLKGRGREDIMSVSETDEIVRYYDGKDNPLGKAYSESEITELFAPYFEVERVALFFFPMRSLPFRLPGSIHRWLAKKFGFMIHLNLIRKTS